MESYRQLWVEASSWQREGDSEGCQGLGGSTGSGAPPQLERDGNGGGWKPWNRGTVKIGKELQDHRVHQNV